MGKNAGLTAATAPHAYRPDIDGLRAIAVLAVVLFHAFPAALPGGFVGVDVFFVISGYLITGLILDDLGAGRFSVWRFYQRRIRRIFPALLLVLVACGAAGWWLLVSPEYQALGRHVASASVFASNFTLLSESGYFDEAAVTKPLLHLWSLAIEEQFYVAWPLLLWLAIRTRLTALRLAIVGALASFALCVLQMSLEPAAAFYEPLARAWELLAGAVLAVSARGPAPAWWRAVAGWRGLSWCGLVAIAVAATLFDARTPFPGWAALLPVLGSSAILAAGPGAPLNVRLGASRWLVGIGLVSYPLYLWHWPLLSLARIVAGHTPGVPSRLLLVAGAGVLAWATWRGLEVAARAPRHAVGKALALLAAMAVVGVCGAVVDARGGLPERASVAAYEGKFRELHKIGWPDSAGIACTAAAIKAPPVLRYCERSRASAPTLALVGDSHADHLFHGLQRVDTAHAWLLIGHNATPPLLDVQTMVPVDPQDRQALTQKAVRVLAADASIRTVLVAFYGNSYLPDEPFSADQQLPGNSPGDITMSSTRWPGATKARLMFLGLDATVRELRAAGKNVVLVMDVPELPFFPKDCIARPGAAVFERHCVLPRPMVDEREAGFRQILAQVAAANPGVAIYDPTPLLCDARACRFESRDALLYRDSNHLTMTGSTIVAADLLAWLDARGLR